MLSLNSAYTLSAARDWRVSDGAAALLNVTMHLKRFLAAALLMVAMISARAEVAVGDVFPPLDGFELTGGEVPETAGQVVLVDFWASWCAPCKASFPVFAKLHGEFASRGLAIVAVSVDEKAAAFASFVKKWKPPFPALLDHGQKLVGQVKVPAMPTSYLVDRTGRVRFVLRGFHGAESERELRERIETLLAENPSRP